MEQPELGKKILELRKAKGLTQEELVKQCNINVRTLQRIESGEVIPRSFTVKAIFQALKYEIQESDEVIFPTLNKSKSNYSIWLEQIYRYVFNVLNLKKDTMKKLSFLSILTISIVLFSINQKSLGQGNERKKLTGTWQLKSAIYNGSSIVVKEGSLKKFNEDGTFVNSKLLLNQNVVTTKGIFYLSCDSIYTEYVNETATNLSNKSMNSFVLKLSNKTFTIDGDIYLTVNPDMGTLVKYHIYEVWEKQK